MRKIYLTYSIGLAVLICSCPLSRAGVIELSGGFAFSQSHLGDSSLQWTRRWSGAVGYYFLALSEIEFSVQDVFYQTKVASVEDTSFHDRIYSVDWVQSLAGRSSLIQPYFKVGIGQLNREASGTYYGGLSPPKVYDSLTGVIGVGLKIQVLKFLALKGEGVSYLSEGVISTWRDNFALQTGFSIFF